MLPKFRVLLTLEATDEKLSEDDVIAVFEDVMYDLPELDLKRIKVDEIKG